MNVGRHYQWNKTAGRGMWSAASVQKKIVKMDTGHIKVAPFHCPKSLTLDSCQNISDNNMHMVAL